MRLLKLLLVLFVCAAGPAVAGPFEDGVVAYGNGDYATALRLWRPLAEQGNAGAQTNLGVMYDLGNGVPQDYTTVVSWLQKAADQGYALAQGRLARMYQRGRGVPQDYVEAHKWFNLAGAQDEFFVSERDSIAAKMTPAQLAEAQKLAREWKPK